MRLLSHQLQPPQRLSDLQVKEPLEQQPLLLLEYPANKQIKIECLVIVEIPKMLDFTKFRKTANALQHAIGTFKNIPNISNPQLALGCCKQLEVHG